MKSQDTTWNQLLEQSAELAGRLTPIIVQKLQSRSPRFEVIRDLSSLAVKNAESVRLLLRAENFNPAMTQLRTQYEAVVKPVWVHFSASKPAVNKLVVALLVEDLARRADNQPMAKEMLDDLAAGGGTPRRILRSLLRFRAGVLKESNSAVHSGAYAIFLQRSGHPEPLLVQLIQASNDLLMASARLQVALYGSRAQREELALIEREFASCLPPLRTASSV